MLKFVYVSGPMSKGDLIGHVRAAIVAGDKIIEAGGVPYLPQLCVLWELASPKAYEHWLEMDLAWVDRCDCLVRLPGESAGADREAARASAAGKPVFQGVEAYVEAMRNGVILPPHDPLDEVKNALVEFCQGWGPWDSGNPDHTAGDEPEARLYNASVRACHAGHLPRHPPRQGK